MPKVTPEHLEARRRQILHAATECFAENGFHRTTIQDIVRHSGLSPGAIYRYFDGKDDLVEAVADARHARERADIAAAMESRNPGESLRELADAFLGSLRDPEERERRRIGVQLWAEALRNPRVLQIARRGVEEPRRLFAELIAAAQQRGEIPGQLDAQAVASLMIAVFQGFVLQLAWDEELEVDPYLAVVDWWIGSVLGPSEGTRSSGPGSS